jgi:hypothetical protein
VSVGTEQAKFRGKTVMVPAVTVCDRRVISAGRWPRIAKILDEEWLEGELVANPDAFVDEVRRSGLRADILTFPARPGSDVRLRGARSETDNVAVICTREFEAWWTALPQEARKNTRRAAKKGIVIRPATLDDRFVQGIKAIYDETPVRQGRSFWHYGKDIETIRRENGTYLDRAQFIGAYLGDELVGFMKWVYVDQAAKIMQILCMNSQQDKRPMIALIAKAAELCHEKGMLYLVYGKFTYGKKADSSITEFKRRLGFTQVDFSRHYVGLTWRGGLALRLGLHNGWTQLMPGWLVSSLLSCRARWLGRFTSDRPSKIGTVQADA